MGEDDILALFGDDPRAAQIQARALAEAMRQRKAAGTVQTIIGGPHAAAGQAFLRGAAADQADLMGAGQFRAQQGLRRQAMDDGRSQFAAQQAQRERELEANQRYRDANLGLEREKLGLLKGDKAKSDEAKKAADRSKRADDLRTEFQKHGTFKNTQELSEALAKVRSAPDNGSGDLSLIYAYAKILDPGSVVKEGEIKLSREPTPLLDQLTTQYKKAAEGRLLHPNLRAEYKQAAESLWNAQVGKYQELASPYRRMARESGIPEGDVVLDFGYAPAGAPANPASAQPAAPQRMQGNDGKWYRMTDAGWEAE